MENEENIVASDSVKHDERNVGGENVLVGGEGVNAQLQSSQFTFGFAETIESSAENDTMRANNAYDNVNTGNVLNPENPFHTELTLNQPVNNLPENNLTANDEQINVQTEEGMSESTNAWEVLVDQAPSGWKIVNKCDQVETTCLTSLPINATTGQWEPVKVFTETSNQNHLHSVINNTLSGVKGNFTNRTAHGENYIKTLEVLAAQLVALSIAATKTPITAATLANKVNSMKELLLRKNISYQNSALSPESVFGTLDAKDQLHSRINDKLNRIKNNTSYQSEGYEDAVDDLIGYIILLLIYHDTISHN